MDITVKSWLLLYIFNILSYEYLSFLVLYEYVWTKHIFWRGFHSPPRFWVAVPWHECNSERSEGRFKTAKNGSPASVIGQWHHMTVSNGKTTKNGMVR